MAQIDPRDRVWPQKKRTPHEPWQAGWPRCQAHVSYSSKALGPGTLKKTRHDTCRLAYRVVEVMQNSPAELARTRDSLLVTGVGTNVLLLILIVNKLINLFPSIKQSLCRGALNLQWLSRLNGHAVQLTPTCGNKCPLKLTSLKYLGDVQVVYFIYFSLTTNISLSAGSPVPVKSTRLHASTRTS